MSRGRRYTGEGSPLPLAFEGIKAWADLKQVHITPYEVEIIERLDNLFISTK